MRSIGVIIKETRTKKKLSREKLERLTKIRKEFIEALEEDNWSKLPEYPVVVGFVKNISKILKINVGRSLAILRRDYPPQDLRINPKPDVSAKFAWNPKLTFVAGVILVTFFILSYLAYQYFSFIKPPRLLLETPTEGQVVRDRVLKVAGITDPEANIIVNNQPTLVDEDGRFAAEIEIFEGTETIVVGAKSRSGKETIITRKIKPDLNE